MLICARLFVGRRFFPAAALTSFVWTLSDAEAGDAVEMRQSGGTRMAMFFGAVALGNMVGLLVAAVLFPVAGLLGRYVKKS